MEAATHLGWQLAKLCLAWSSALFSASLLLYMLLRPFIPEDKDGE